MTCLTCRFSRWDGHKLICEKRLPMRDGSMWDCESWEREPGSEG